jgi:hypothetical protein
MGKTVKFIYITLSLLLFVSDIAEAHAKTVVEAELSLEDYEPYVDEIIRIFAKEMRKKFGLVCIGNE